MAAEIRRGVAIVDSDSATVNVLELVVPVVGLAVIATPVAIAALKGRCRMARAELPSSDAVKTSNTASNSSLKDSHGGRASLGIGSAWRQVPSATMRGSA